jgi:hypothetical protein
VAAQLVASRVILSSTELVSLEYIMTTRIINSYSYDNKMIVS